MTKPTTLPEPQVTANPKYETSQQNRGSEEDNRRIIDEADACTERGQLSALCRRENIQAGQITTWRRRFAEDGAKGLEIRTLGRKPAMTSEARELERVTRENERLRQQLEVKDYLLELPKNAFAIVERLNGEKMP